MAKAVLIRKPYDSHERVQKTTGSGSLVQGDAQDECDINKLMAKYERTGFMGHMSARPGRYEDLMGMPSYHEALNQVIEAREAFELLPAKWRARFNNDPAELLGALDDPERRPELERLGIVRPKEVQGAEPLPPGEGGGDGSSQGAAAGGPAEPAEGP